MQTWTPFRKLVENAVDSWWPSQSTVSSRGSYDHFMEYRDNRPKKIKNLKHFQKNLVGCNKDGHVTKELVFRLYM